MADEFGQVRIVLEDGTELTGWDSYTINSDFMTPADGWQLSVGGDKVWAEVHSLLQPDYKIQIYVDSAIQLTGWIDSVSVESSADGGTRVSIDGRDILKPLIKANIHPDMRIKGRTVEDLVMAVLQMYYITPPDVFFDNESNRQLIGAVKGRAKNRNTSLKKQIEYCQAHPSEGAFEFLARNLRRFGLWMWATSEGGVVVAGPNYDQPPSYEIERHRNVHVPSVLSARMTWDRTDVPSSIRIRGKSAAKEFDKADSVGSLIDREARMEHYVEPFYIVHDQAETKEQALAFAQQEMSRVKQREMVYECTCIGHRDPKTKNVYAIDTIATVDDQFCDVRGSFYVISRTFRKSVGGGTTTDLKMVPLYTIQFGDADAPPTADTKVKKGDTISSEDMKANMQVDFGQREAKMAADAQRVFR